MKSKSKGSGEFVPPPQSFPGFLIEGWIEENEAVRGPRPHGPTAETSPPIPEYLVKEMDEKLTRRRHSSSDSSESLPTLPEIVLQPLEDEYNQPRNRKSAKGNTRVVVSGPEVPIYELPDEPRGLWVFLAHTWTIVRDAFHKPERIRYQDWDD